MGDRVRRLPVWVAAILAGTLVLAACGGGGGGGGSSQSGEGEADPNGILRVGTVLVGSGEPQFDPTSSKINSDEPWLSLIYGTLLRPTAEGPYEPWLAESYDVADPSSVSVRLHEGITFSDGTPYDAEAVRTGILRSLHEPTDASVAAGRHSLFQNLTDITVEGPLEVRFVLDQPVAGEFLAVLASRESAVPSPQALADGIDLNVSPVGAGPYLFDGYRPGQAISLRKNPDFFDAGSWQMAGIDFVDTPSGPAGVSALRSGTVDILAGLTPSDAQALEADDRFEVVRHFTDFNFMYASFCSSKPPFDDIRVRQAFQHAIDRDGANQLWLSGQGEPAYGFWRDESPNFHPELPELVGYDPVRAEQLLAEAGATGIEIDLWYSGGQYQRLMEVLQGQLGDVGITANLRSSQDIISEFIIPQQPGAVIFPGSRSSVDKVNRLFQPTAVQNLCGGQHPEIVELSAQIAELPPGAEEREELWQEIDRINAEGVHAVLLVWSPTLVGIGRDRVGGDVHFTESRTPTVWADFESMFVKA